jgi:hypothetical protein
VLSGHVPALPPPNAVAVRDSAAGVPGPPGARDGLETVTVGAAKPDDAGTIMSPGGVS